MQALVVKIVFKMFPKVSLKSGVQGGGAWGMKYQTLNINDW